VNENSIPNISQSNSFQPGALLSLPELFAGRAFRVPNYQRSYSWEQSNVIDLLKDIDNLIDNEVPDYIHYAGTIVAIPYENTTEADTFFHQPPHGCKLLDIIDGQQRLTTLLILASELSHQLAGFDQPRSLSMRARYLVDETSEFDVRRRFSVSEDADQYYFESAIQRKFVSDRPENKSHKNLQVARDEIENWLGRVSPERIQRIASAMERQIGFLLYIPRSHSEVGLMFEIINNRGKRLSELEKVKNYLVYFGTRNNAPSLIHSISNAWPRIMLNMAEANVLTNVEENSFIGHVWQVFRPREESSWDPYPGLKEMDNAPRAMIDFVELLAASAQTLALIETQKGLPRELARPLLHLSLQPSTAQVRPLVFAVFYRERDSTRCASLISLIEKLSFRFYGCNIAKRSDSKQAELFQLANIFYHHYNTNFDGQQITADWLLGRLVAFVQDNAPDKNIVKELTLDEGEGGDFYNWRGLKYFLACYEEWLAEEVGKTVDLKRMLALEDSEHRTDFYHREHLWAVGCPEPVKDTKHQNKRRLGNFVLLEGPINISVNNKTLQQKIYSHFETGKRNLRPNTAMLDELHDFLKSAEEKLSAKWKRKVTAYWLDVYTQFFDDRETKMLTFALKRWRVDYEGSRLTEFRVDSFRNKNNDLPGEIQDAAR
jgi:hypothetical protein